MPGKVTLEHFSGIPCSDSYAEMWHTFPFGGNICFGLQDNVCPREIMSNILKNMCQCRNRLHIQKDW